MRQPVMASAAAAVASLAILFPNAVVAISEKSLVHAQHTQTVDLAPDGVSPKPTAAPLFGASDLGLLRRQEAIRDSNNTDQTVLVAPDRTCGYISDRSGAFFTCAGDFTCLFYTAEASATGNVACCQNYENCNMRSACVASKDFEKNCDNGCLIDIFTVKCTQSNAPFCNTVSFPGGIYDYWCNNADIKGPQAADTTYSGQGSRIFQAVALTDVFTQTSDKTTSSTITTTGTSTSGAVISGTGNATDSNGNKDDYKAPVGPIVGGAIGGAGAIGVGGLATWLLMRRRRKTKAASSDGSASTQATPQAYTAVPMAHGAQATTPPAGYYDHMGQYYNVQHHVPPPASSTPGTMRTNTVSPAYGGQYPPPQQVIYEAPSKHDDTLRDRHELQ